MIKTYRKTATIRAEQFDGTKQSAININYCPKCGRKLLGGTSK